MIHSILLLQCSNRVSISTLHGIGLKIGVLAIFGVWTTVLFHESLGIFKKSVRIKKTYPVALWNLIDLPWNEDKSQVALERKICRSWYEFHVYHTVITSIRVRNFNIRAAAYLSWRIPRPTLNLSGAFNGSVSLKSCSPAEVTLGCMFADWYTWRQRIPSLSVCVRQRNVFLRASCVWVILSRNFLEKGIGSDMSSGRRNSYARTFALKFESCYRNANFWLLCTWCVLVDSHGSSLFLDSLYKTSTDMLRNILEYDMQSRFQFTFAI